MLIKTLKWPAISFLVFGGILLFTQAILPDLAGIFQPPVLAPVLLAFGIWIGYKRVQFGGSFGQVYFAGALFGILPALLYVLDIGFLLGRGVSASLPGGVFGFDMIVFGSVIGGGFALSKT